MASVVIIVLLTLLLLVKGGTQSHVFLAWSGIVMIIALFMQFRAIKNTVPLFNLKFRQISKMAMDQPLLILLMLQFWLVLQIVLGVTQNTQASIDDVLLGVGFLSFLTVLGSLNWDRLSMKQLLIGLFIIAAAQTVYGLWVFLTQSNVILWMEKIHYLDKPTGTLVNANHFSAYLSLTLVLLVAFVICRQQQKTQHSSVRRSIFNLLEQLYSVYTLFAVLLIVAILSTRSFGGIGSLLVTAMVAFSAVLWQKVVSWQKTSRRELTILMCLVFVVLVFVLMVFAFSDYSVLQKEFASISFTIERRFEISRAAIRMVVDNWLLGVGSGGFYSSFSQYRDITVGNSFYHFAHNDYLQFWAEYGLIGIMLCLSFISVCLYRNWQVLKRSKNSYKRSFAYASFYGTVLLGVHSLVDFPLQVPAYALLYLTILCFNVVTDKPRTQ